MAETDGNRGDLGAPLGQPRSKEMSLSPSASLCLWDILYRCPLVRSRTQMCHETKCKRKQHLDYYSRLKTFWFPFDSETLIRQLCKKASLWKRVKSFVCFYYVLSDVINFILASCDIRST